MLQRRSAQAQAGTGGEVAGAVERAKETVTETVAAAKEKAGELLQARASPPPSFLSPLLFPRRRASSFPHVRVFAAWSLLLGGAGSGQGWGGRFHLNRGCNLIA